MGKPDSGFNSNQEEKMAFSYNDIKSALD